MTELDPTLVVALADLVRGFHALKLRFCLIGALVPQLLLDEPSLTSDDVLALGADLSFHVVGFDQLFDSPLTIDAHGLTLPLAPVPLYVLLKLVAYEDRKAPKDLGSIVHCLRHYDERDERRYGVEDQGELVPFEFTTAYLLGRDARRFAHGPLATVVANVLTELEDVDSIGIDLAAREEGWLSASTAQRREVTDLFRWFRRGAGV